MTVRPSIRVRAFSLVEMLVAIAVLALILVFVLQAVSAVSSTWRHGMARIDNFSKARSVLGLLDRDVQAMVLRNDLAAFVDENGLPSCSFYALVNGSEGNRRLSFVRYLVSTNGTQLLRADYGLDYSNRTLSLNNTNSLPDSTQALPQNLVDGVLLFECQFLGSDGVFQPKFEHGAGIGTIPTKTLVVSLLVLDGEALQVLEKTGSRSSLLAGFPGAPAAGQTYAQYWNDHIHASNFVPGLPPSVRAGIRTFQRHIVIP